MENRVKTRLSRIFRGSLNSCKTKHFLDAVENAVLIPENDQQPPHASSTKSVVKPSPLPSLCKPRHYSREKTKPITSSIVPSRKLYSFLAEEGFQCPPASPLSPFLNPFYSSLPKKISRKKKERKRSQEANSVFRSYSQDSAYYNNWLSSEDEEGNEQALEEEADDSVFFSSRSNTISSDSSGSSNMAVSKRHRPRKGRKRRRRASTTTTTTTTTTSSSVSSSRSSRTCSNHKGKEVNVKPLTSDLGPGDQSSIKESFAVVKSSSDPRNDFMTSMMEMIVEKQILGADELEYLLWCFLSLNSDHHHGTIIKVFDEICEALFSG